MVDVGSLGIEIPQAFAQATRLDVHSCLQLLSQPFVQSWNFFGVHHDIVLEYSLYV